MTHPPLVSVTPNDLWTAWNIEPSILIPFLVIAAIYLKGMLNVWQRAGAGHGIGRWRSTSFGCALLAIIVAFVSPIDALSEVLFSVHMVQHMILILIVAPLLVMSDFHLAFLWALPGAWVKVLIPRLNQNQTLSKAWKVLSNPVFAWLSFSVALWAWHAPAFYEAALNNKVFHIFEHAVFLTTALLFWWVLLKPIGQKYLHYGMAIPYLFTTVLQSGILGALMSFTSRPWYPTYTTLVTPWGLTPLQDQQIAGLTMWIPVGMVFSLLTIGYLAAWLHALEQRTIQFQGRGIFERHHE